MLDLSGSPADQLKFLPGLKESTYAPRGQASSRIRIDLETGAVVLVNGGDEARSSARGAQGRERLRNEIGSLDEEDIFKEGNEEICWRERNVHVDLMALRGDLEDGVEEMDWE